MKAFHLNPRFLGYLALSILLLAGAAHFMPETGIFLPWLKVTVATAALVLAPGLVVLNLRAPRRLLQLSECLALSMAIGFVLSLLMVVAAMSLNISLIKLTTGFYVLSLMAAIGGVVFARSGREKVITTAPELLLLAGLFGFSIFLYAAGTPLKWGDGEDFIHVSVIRRLARLEAPSLHNTYWAAHVIYTYPFPAIHSLFASISILGGIDPMFVYQKMYGFWLIPAQLFVMLGSLLLTRSRRIAVLTGWICLLFSLNGSFGKVDQYSWGQLVPLSHASDIAMNVYLPALLVAFGYYLTSRERGKHLMFAVTMGLAGLLVAVHIRELIQFHVYLVAFVIALAIFNRDKTLLRRTGLVLVSCMVLTLLYMKLHSHLVGHINEFVTDLRKELVDWVKGASLSALTVKQFDHHSFVVNIGTFTYHWFAPLVIGLALLSGGVRRSPFLLFTSASIFAYLLIVRLPFLSVPYVYATYFEILFTPVRNVAFFAYCGAGAVFLLMLKGIRSALEPKLGWAAYALAGGALIGVYRIFHKTGFNWVSGYLVAAALIFAVVLFARGRWARFFQELSRVRHVPLPGVSGLAALTVTVLAGTWNSTAARTFAAAPFNLRLSDAYNFPQVADVDRRFPHEPDKGHTFPPFPELKAPAGTSFAPPKPLRDWVNSNLFDHAVLAINILNKYSPNPFVDVQAAYWPHLDSLTGYYFRRIFPEYYKWLDSHLNQRKVQPFYNTVDSREERVQFLRDIKATHALVDPMVYDELKPQLERQGFHAVFDSPEDKWMIVEPPKDDDASH